MSSEDRIELEPVTCWPLIYAAAGLVCLGILAVAGLALWNVLKPRSEPMVQHLHKPDSRRAGEVRHAEAVAVSEQPVPVTPQRQVVVKREVINHYAPLPPLSVPLRKQPPPSRPVVPRPRPGAAKPAASQVVSGVLGEWAQKEDVKLADLLWKQSKQIDLEKEEGTVSRLMREGTKNLEERQAIWDKRRMPPLRKTICDLLQRRDDLRGLPLAAENTCQSSVKAAKLLATVSRNVRSAQALRDDGAGFASSIPIGSPDFVLIQSLRQLATQHKKEPLIVGQLVQLFQVETIEVRLELIKTLAAIPGKEASQALAGRAIFDLSPKVRKAAALALQERSTEARSVLLAGLRHPWTPAAYHAAAALVVLNDQKSVVELEKLRDQPDPCAPFQEGKKWYVRELVRANHLRNCLLCHAPSIDRKDIVTGPIPTPGKELPERVYYGRGSSDPAVRADIVYFRQDFSVMHAVSDAKPWPEMQRFDYLVRKRELTLREADKLTVPRAGKSQDGYPQREAVDAAIAELKRRKREKGEAK